MKVRLNNPTTQKINTGRMKTNLFNQTRMKLYGTPGFSGGETTFRILEDNDFRITEDGYFRILE